MDENQIMFLITNHNITVSQKQKYGNSVAKTINISPSAEVGERRTRQIKKGTECDRTVTTPSREFDMAGTEGQWSGCRLRD